MPGPEVERRNFRRYDKDNGQTGLLVPVTPISITTRTVTANRAYGIRFVPSRPMNIISIAWSVTTAAGSNDAVDVGIYSVSGGDITRVASAGATLALLNSTGVKNLALTATANLQPGVIYYALQTCGAIGTTAAVVDGASYSSGNIAVLNGVTIGKAEAVFADAAHPLPATITTPSTGPGSAPLLFLREV